MTMVADIIIMTETTGTTGINKAFIIGIVLNLVYVLVQVIIGLKINSLSLLSDAGHNFLDVAGLALAMLAFKLSKSKSTEEYTYGYKKSINFNTLAQSGCFIGINWSNWLRSNCQISESGIFAG